MAILKNIKIQNLRSLRDVGEVPISKITVLLGKNSVGKSTFARIFPLLRQSVESKKRSPILWFGDYVDFGSLEQAISRGEKEISLGFNFSINYDFERFDPYSYRLEQTSEYRIYGERLFAVGDVKVVLTLIGGDVVTTKRLQVSTGDVSFEIVFKDEEDKFESLIFNGETIDLPENIKVFTRQGNVLPLMFFATERRHKDRTFLVRTSLSKGASQIKPAVQRAISKFGFFGVDAVADSLTKSRVKTPEEFATKADYARSLQRDFVLDNCFKLVEIVDEAMKDYFSSVKYLKPLRATAERYYRRQDLSVQEIDPEGRNLPMFLDSLSSSLLKNFQEFLGSILKISVSAKREGGQIMVMAKGEDDADSYNIADMGFGISQVLPIAAQLWMVNNSRTNKASAVVIEQPELHLHPEYQSRLADVFAAAVKPSKKNNNNDVSLIIETHSPHIVNRLGELVEQGKLSAEDVSILLFEPSEDQQKSVKVNVSNFDEEGVLQNWPFGFFEPEFNNVD
ncbi:DUF3696 domain-containing protein [Comamonas guangdongensis]|uniref:DUF3696 domain-containing protein n=1 Tax=Comamonas guangdongensis TaxID=510515 RepID=A0ABV3ZS30_9BURK